MQDRPLGSGEVTERPQNRGVSVVVGINTHLISVQPGMPPATNVTGKDISVVNAFQKRLQPPRMNSAWMQPSWEQCHPSKTLHGHAHSL